MTDRFSPAALVKEAWDSLRQRTVVGAEPHDWAARLTLLVLPAAGLGVSIWLDWSIRDSGSLIAGLSLLAAALFAIVPQFAAWRQRLTERARPSEGIAQRKLDEVVAHTLLAAVVAIGLVAIAVVLGNISTPVEGSLEVVVPWVARILTGIMVGGGTYLILTMMLVVNLLFDAYRDANGLAERAAGGDERWRDQDAA
ncbi:hypothetical protein [Cellulomonas phragmiteti]|uniref:Uncharacterized protein n=1 Tax=Cellulomonas phragmiteti TaxID=478780 RepID=A0ABQ4DSF7_9CELL|nr:hypothetical protein [Cellulomonas phragmiteti]GIG41932.1 hypothetical protein Cph01nite_36940 [Cellulomonas phragmiteti]